MSTTVKASLRFTILAYSVYCWVDGSARARTGISSTFDIDVPRQSNSQPNLDDTSPQRWTKIWDWLQRRGCRTSEDEQAMIGRVDAITAFLLFNGIQRVSLTSTQTHSALPTAFPYLKDGGRLSWRLMLAATALLSLLHETQRAAIIYHLRSRRVDLTEKIRKDLANMRIGEVVVRGDNMILPRNVDEQEEEEECLICTGAAETMSTSSHTLDGDRSSPSLGPLEAFCTIAPQKHLTHRSCFLRWHAAYLQQSRSSYGHSVTLVDDPQPSQAPSSSSNSTRSFEQLFIRASIILQAAGFDYLAPKLKRTRPSPATADSQTASVGENQCPTLTLHYPDSTHATQSLLATLRTSAPPCPGCRSPVALRFIDARPPIPLTSSDGHQPPLCSSPTRLLKVALLLRRLVASKFWREWPVIVTGRTLSTYFGSLLSFIAVLVAITRARENPALNKNLSIRFASSRLVL
ncbi:hypothetical protein BDV93DRAFT_522448 [Ceratobasidium sp. AG-I]|nr:hypothetical protein BDV93DRAFT_522448 [Ceratobasidium sp. AG-I]